jgi:biopolymer transport protein TolQ
MQEFSGTTAWLVTASSTLDVWSLVEQASTVVKGVMALLVLMSVFSWYIIAYKYLYIRRAHRESRRFLDSFWRSKDIDQIYSHAQALRRSPVSSLFLAGYTELAKLASDHDHGRDRDADLESVERALRRAQTIEITRLESMTPFLATTGSAAPFIGLFGTVWGIMNSFREIGALKTATIQAVAPGIAEALIATAIGLVAAIPAVMAYNYFVRRIRVSTSHMDTFAQDYLNIIRRHFLK